MNEKLIDCKYCYSCTLEFHVIMTYYSSLIKFRRSYTLIHIKFSLIKCIASSRDYTDICICYIFVSPLIILKSLILNFDIHIHTGFRPTDQLCQWKGSMVSSCGNSQLGPYGMSTYDDYKNLNLIFEELCYHSHLSHKEIFVFLHSKNSLKYNIKLSFKQ